MKCQVSFSGVGKLGAGYSLHNLLSLYISSVMPLGYYCEDILKESPCKMSENRQDKYSSRKKKTG